MYKFDTLHTSSQQRLAADQSLRSWPPRLATTEGVPSHLLHADVRVGAAPPLFRAPSRHCRMTAGLHWTRGMHGHYALPRAAPRRAAGSCTAPPVAAPPHPSHPLIPLPLPRPQAISCHRWAAEARAIPPSFCHLSSRRCLLLEPPPRRQDGESSRRRALPVRRTPMLSQHVPPPASTCICCAAYGWTCNVGGIGAADGSLVPAGVGTGGGGSLPLQKRSEDAEAF